MLSGSPLVVPVRARQQTGGGLDFFMYKSTSEKRRLARRAAEGLGRTKVKGVDPLRYATHAMRLEVFKRDGGRCRYCGVEVTLATANMDHVIAWKRHGATLPSNLVTACALCNKAKRNSHSVRPRHLGKKPRDHFKYKENP